MHVAVSRSLFEDRVGRFPPDLDSVCGWVFHRLAYPVIDCEFTHPGRTPLRLHLDFTDWDDQPPSASLRNSVGEILKTLPPNPTGVFNAGGHPTTGHPFLCTAGIREFHTHPSHLNEPWDQFRGKPGFDIGDIVAKIWHAWLKGNN